MADTNNLKNDIAALRAAATRDDNAVIIVQIDSGALRRVLDAAEAFERATKVYAPAEMINPAWTPQQHKRDTHVGYLLGVRELEKGEKNSMSNTNAFDAVMLFCGLLFIGISFYAD